MRVHFKICGITSVEDAEHAVAAGASAIGLNFVPASSRAIDVATARRIVERVAGRALSVLVVANETVERVEELLRLTGAGCAQLHGDESEDDVRRLLPHAYKAIRVGAEDDVTRALAYPGEHVLVDAKVAGLLGGTGVLAPWNLVRSLARARKLTLAGGLHPGNVARAIAEVAPYCVDVAGGVEIDGDPRRKDRDKMVAFGRAVAEGAPGGG